MGDKKIGIGISTYNDWAMTYKLVKSIKELTKFDGEYKILVWDDGSIKPGVLNQLSRVCSQYSVIMYGHDINRGIPATWNSIIRYFQEKQFEYVIVLNNDLECTESTWLEHGYYVLDNNPIVGMVGFPLIQVDHSGNKIIPPEGAWGVKPNIVGASIGCCYGTKVSAWLQVKNPDGVNGFWEELKSFHEECFFGFKLTQIGYRCLMIPWPPFVHWGGQTFAKNPELCLMPFNEKYGTLDEYVDVVKNSSLFPKEWKEIGKYYVHVNNIVHVDRMAYTRYLFAKHWNVLEHYKDSMQPVHERLIYPLEPMNIKWLDKDMKEQISLDK